jgi:two-component system, OmpR family, phosphate regulon response regulator OmpR
MTHLLVIDDDRRIRELLKSFLEDKGYRVSTAGNAIDARAALQGLTFDLILLDVMMPGESGTELAAALRQATNATPILMLSALTETDDRIKGLAAGGDDYLAKPFDPRELLLRIENLLRRTQRVEKVTGEVSFGIFVFDIERGELRSNGVNVHLTSREKDLMRKFAQQGGQSLSRQDLAGHDDTTRGVDVHINRLRQKIEDNPSLPIYLQTVRGAGYALYLDKAKVK